MSTQTRVVRLLQNTLYPTYQLHATMSNKQNTPAEGLRFAALTVMEWLRQRIGEDIPQDLVQPEPERYKEADDSCLPSLHIHRGYVVDIVSLPSQGVWSLQITEPDLGSEPGNPAQQRQAVPGRVIETNIGFCIQGKTLECGFQTVISDPVGSGAQAEVYRLAVVRRLMESPVFGLTHILPLNGGTSSLRNTAELRKMLTLTTAPENQLPTVIFTYHLSEPENRNPQTVLDLRLPSVSFPELARPGRTQESLFCAAVSQEKSPPTSTLPYNAGAFAEKRKGCCRVYLLDAALIQDLAAELNCKLRPGDAVLLEPACFGGGSQVFPYHPASREREKTIGLLSCAVYDYPRGKTWNFGSVQFLSAAREELLLKTSEMAKTSQAASDQWTQKFTQLDTAYKAELAKKDEELAGLRTQIDRLREYEKQLEKEKNSLAQAMELERQNCRFQIQARDGEVAYLRRKLTQPQKHTEVVEWAQQQFADRLVMHKRTETLLAKKTAWGVDLGLLCDALDFLATDYWEQRFKQLPVDEMNRRCSAKYQRPFDVSRLGDMTVEFTPGEYKVKYRMTGTEKAREYPLNWHLKVGNDPENLLRIYFFHDDKARKLVIGSLPEHLRAVQIR